MKIAIIDNVSFTKYQIELLNSISDELIIFDNKASDRNEIISRCKDAEIIILGWTKLTSDILIHLNKLQYIAIWATGYDYIDIEYTKSRNILVSNIPNYATIAVAEYTFGAMLNVSRNFIQAHTHVSNGLFSWEGFEGVELNGKTLGIVGFGNIGRKIALLGQAFNMKIISFTRNPSKESTLTLGVSFVTLKELFSTSDFISINMPLTNQTYKLIDKEVLSLMKTTAYLINTSRNELIDQDFLQFQLINQKIKGVALDDMNINDKSLRKLSNVLLTPHIGFFTSEAINRKSEICISNIESFIKGVPTNIINL